MAHKKVFAEGSEEEKYARDALQSGTQTNLETTLVLTLGRVLDKKPLEIQTIFMDCKVGLQQVFRDMAGEGRIESEN
jgi:hypothetical protein